MLKKNLAGFPDFNMERENYEAAAAFFNQLRRKEVQGSSIDFLICTVASRHNIPIFTTDKDFELFAIIYT